MTNEMKYPKRLIENDFPIKEISINARREKSIRHGHISSLHIWWARRPLVACRAVLCGLLWPDPMDSNCSNKFKKQAMQLLKDFQDPLNINNINYTDPMVLRQKLIKFIIEFSKIENSVNDNYLSIARKITQIAHISLGGEKNSYPLVVDPFCGGGAIPLEALRLNSEVFASDLNPVSVLLNKVILEFIPKYGKKLDIEVKKQGERILSLVKNDLSNFYPIDKDGSIPIAYIWARTIKCEGPDCGAEIPLIRSFWLARRNKQKISLKMNSNSITKEITFEIVNNPNLNQINEPTVKRGSAICPICGYVTAVNSVRRQLNKKKGGASDSRMVAIVTKRPSQTGRFYRIANKSDIEIFNNAKKELERRKNIWPYELSLIPDESTPSTEGHRAVASIQLYGFDTWETLYNSRQALTLSTFMRYIKELDINKNEEFNTAVKTCLALIFDKMADLANSLCPWDSTVECPHHLFSRQAIPMTWDYAESVIIGNSSGSWQVLIDRFSHIMEKIGCDWKTSSPQLLSAINNPLPDDCAHVFMTDPPYYDSVDYADLSDFFYVWLKRMLADKFPNLLNKYLTPKEEQAIVWHPNSQEERKEFENKMKLSMIEGKRILKPSGIGLVIFAHKSTEGWESLLQSMFDAGWVISASWPIDTEMGSRVNAAGTASLASSIHLVCRPRESDIIGDWRDILDKLPNRIHDWLPRLADEGVVGADAIFSCIGPALEIFSKYSIVEKASGQIVTLKEYLEHVWAVVSKEAINMILEGADATGFEEDARLTAIWLWTISTGRNNTEKKTNNDIEESIKSEKSIGFILEYDTVRKIAQGLGAHLEELPNLVEIKGDKAKLLPVSERAKYLFRKEQVKVRKKPSKKDKQITLWGEDTDKEKEIEELSIDGYSEPGKTVLDQLHQSMLLFAEGKNEALKRLIVEDGVGNDPRFWKLAQALSALYPKTTEEKRWVDGVMGRKKSLGF